jgi:hypothetical protein
MHILLLYITTFIVGSIIVLVIECYIYYFVESFCIEMCDVMVT